MIIHYDNIQNQCHKGWMISFDTFDEIYRTVTSNGSHVWFEGAWNSNCYEGPLIVLIQETWPKASIRVFKGKGDTVQVFLVQNHLVLGASQDFPCLGFALLDAFCDAMMKENKMQDKTVPSEMLEYFAFDHLPEKLKPISSIFHDTAHRLCALVPDNHQRQVALQKLLEAKDAAVRAGL